jgi:protein TonB
LSLLGHGIAVSMLPAHGSQPPPPRRVEMAFYEPSPPPPKVEEPPKEEPPKPLEPPKIKVKPAVVKLAELTPPPKEEAPPPPNQTPPDKPTQPVLIVTGISLESTSTAGTFAAPVGNTAYGKADKVVDPSQVKAYAAPKYAPPGGADVEPVLEGEVKIPYPEEAKKNEVEGSVRLKVTLSPEGQVTEVAVISGPGYGLNDAAKAALKKFRFRPALKGGEPVGYTFIYTYTFLLD